MQTLLAYDGPELVPVNISSAAAALSDVLRDELNDNNCEAFELPSEFTLDATKAFVDYLEAQASHDQFTISRPLPESQPVDLASAGVPSWAVMYVQTQFGRTSQQDLDEGAGRGHAVQSGADTLATPTDNDINWPLLFNTLKLAQFLHAESLMTLLAARIACRVRGWSDGQREAVFTAVSRAGILTQQERAAIRSANGWAEREPALEQQLRGRPGV